MLYLPTAIQLTSILWLAVLCRYIVKPSDATLFTPIETVSGTVVWGHTTTAGAAEKPFVNSTSSDTVSFALPSM